MRIIRPEDFLTQPWKNGGGITHEIARADQDGALLWRLSIAEVASDGPFSAFPGLSRILTVIEGAGLYLDTPGGRLDALPLQPLAFPGDLPVASHMIDGPIRDFNVIWDDQRLTARVTPLDGALPACPAAAGRFYALLTLTAGFAPLPAGAIALTDQFEARPIPGFRALLADFQTRL